MKKMILTLLLGISVFTTAFVVYDQVATTSEETAISEGEYGGPFRRFFQKFRRQRPKKDVAVEMIVQN